MVPAQSRHLILRDVSTTSVKYRAILDDGRRCRSCCNRANLFGLRDHGSGWEGDCAECNIRWYKGQVMSTCRHLRTMLLSNSLFGLEGFPTQQVQQFANLDLDFYRRGVDFKRQVRVLTETFTNVVDSDDEYFDSCAVALAKFPLSLLSEIPLGSSAYACSLLKGLPCMRLSLLHVIATFLLPPPRRRGAGRTAHVQSHDYVQTVWRKIRHNGKQWLENVDTGEFFCMDAPQTVWQRYVYRGRFWLVERTVCHQRGIPVRWFWEPPFCVERVLIRKKPYI